MHIYIYKCIYIGITTTQLPFPSCAVVPPSAPGLGFGMGPTAAMDAADLRLPGAHETWGSHGWKKSCTG